MVKILGGIALALVGVCCGFYGVVGGLFVAQGAVRDEPGDSWTDVGILGVLALCGVVIFFVGTKLIITVEGRHPRKGGTPKS